MSENSFTASIAGALRKHQLLADGTLVFVTLIWGSTFVMVKDVIGQVSPILFLAVRFGIGALVLSLFTVATGRWRGFTMRELLWGGIIGLFVGAGYIFQTVGMQWTTASNAGFITGLSVVLVPVLGIFVLRTIPGAWAWLGVLMSAAGLALLSLHVGSDFEVNKGDIIVLGCAVAFAFQILIISKVVQWADPLRLTLVQVIVAGMVNAVGAAIFEQPVAGLSTEIWAAAAFLGVVATALALILQVAVQRFTSAVHTALIFTLEPVFATVFGVMLQGDRFAVDSAAGAGLILGGMLVAELGPQLDTVRQRSGRRAPEVITIPTRTEIPPSDVS